MNLTRQHIGVFARTSPGDGPFHHVCCSCSRHRSRAVCCPTRHRRLKAYDLGGRHGPDDNLTRPPPPIIQGLTACKSRFAGSFNGILAATQLECGPHIHLLDIGGHKTGPGRTRVDQWARSCPMAWTPRSAAPFQSPNNTPPTYGNFALCTRRTSVRKCQLASCRWRAEAPAELSRPAGTHSHRDDWHHVPLTYARRISLACQRCRSDISCYSVAALFDTALQPADVLAVLSSYSEDAAAVTLQSWSRLCGQMRMH